MKEGTFDVAVELLEPHFCGKRFLAAFIGLTQDMNPRHDPAVERIAKLRYLQSITRNSIDTVKDSMQNQRDHSNGY